MTTEFNNLPQLENCLRESIDLNSSPRTEKDPKQNDAVKKTCALILHKLGGSFEEKHLLLHPLSQEQKDQLRVAVDKGNTQEAADIMLGSIKSKDRRLSLTGIAQRAEKAMIVEGGKGDQTTNPVLFLDKENALTPKATRGLRGVFKAKFNTSLNMAKLNSMAQTVGDYHRGTDDKKKEILQKAVDTGWIAPDLLSSEELPSTETFTHEITSKLFKEFQTTLVASEQKLLENFVEGLVKSATSSKKGAKPLANSPITPTAVRAMKELPLTPHNMRLRNNLVQEIGSRAQLKGSQEAVISELKGLMGVMREAGAAEDRYVKTALFATEYDRICGTHVSPPCMEVQVPGKGRGFVQEPMTYIPLAKKKSEVCKLYNIKMPEATLHIQNLIDTLNDFVDTESYQEAMLRTTELCDADLHMENAALIPRVGSEPLPEFTQLNSRQTLELLQFLSKCKSEGGIGTPQEREGLLQNLISLGNQTKGNEETVKVLGDLVNALNGRDGGELTDTPFASAIGRLKELSFDVQLFDVDLTMPKSNSLGVTGGRPPMRNILMALKKANDPLLSAVRERLQNREKYLPQLLSYVGTHFDQAETSAYKERMERLIAAGHKEVMTPRGLVWETSPDYRFAEQAWAYIKVIEEDASHPWEDADFIGALENTNSLFDQEVRGRVKKGMLQNVSDMVSKSDPSAAFVLKTDLPVNEN